MTNTVKENDKTFDNYNNNNNDDDDNDNKVLLRRRTSDEACIALVSSDISVVENNAVGRDNVGVADTVTQTVTSDITTGDVSAASRSPVSSAISVTDPTSFSVAAKTVATPSQNVVEESLPLRTIAVSANCLSPVLSAYTDQPCLSSSAEPYPIEVSCLSVALI